ncbi:MAG: polysaccharide deacetylase family protein [Clostridia bacterium]
MKQINNKMKYCIIGILSILIVYIVLICFNNNKLITFNNEFGEVDYLKEENIIEDVVKPKSFEYNVPIFMYHFILDDYGKNTDVENFLSPDKLEKQLKYIKENGFETIYIRDFDELYKYKKPVALTFDDCFVYFYNNAYPLFKKYNLKASIYVITDYINGENYLTTEQLIEMKNSGLIDIQSHSISHRKLTTISFKEAKNEVINSKLKLKELCGVYSNVFCYPVGDYNSKVVDVVKENYSFCLNMLGGMYNSSKHSRYNIPRIYANRSMSMNEYISYLNKSKVITNY